MAEFPIDLKSELSQFNGEVCAEMMLMDRMKNFFALSDSRQRFFPCRDIFAQDIHRCHHLFRMDILYNTDGLMESFPGDIAHGKPLQQRSRKKLNGGKNRL